MNGGVNILSETTLGLAAAARRLPPNRAGRAVHPATLTRWVLAGVRLPSGALVRLEAVRVGGRWLTSAEAMGRFAAALTAGRCTPPAGAPPVAPINARVERALDAALGPVDAAA